MVEDSPRYETPSGNLICWMLGQKEEENPSLVEEQAGDIAEAGFAGVLLIPRAGRLDLRDPAMLDLLQRAADAGISSGLAIWIMADPRLASDSLIEETGEALEVILINRHPDDPWNGENLNVARIENRRFTWKLNYPESRPTHMHVSGAIACTPAGIERVYAFKRFGEGPVEEIRDITRHARLYHGVPAREIEVFGEVDESLEGWDVIAFPRFRTNFFDYSGKNVWPLWEKFVQDLLDRIDSVSGIAWDEPGFYTEFGKFPAGERIFERFRELNGYDLHDELVWLVLDSSDGRHVRIRNDYYRTLNSIVVDSMQRNLEIVQKAATAKSRSGESIHHGIHATWHGEFAGLEEMSHGSLDLWRIRPTQTAAFTDVGNAERVIYPGSAPDIIYSLVLARSLSRVEPNRGLIYCNLWSVDFGTPDSDAPAEVLDYQRQLLELFSARWLAHGYGWTGTKHMDRGFGPGYPNHPTWSKWPELNDAMHKGEAEESRDPVGDVLMIFPLESFYETGHDGANSIGNELMKLVDTLTRSGYQLDIASPEWLSKAYVGHGMLTLNGCHYNSVLLPYCNVIPESAWEVIRRASDAGFTTIADLPSSPVIDPSGESLPPLERYEAFDLQEGAAKRIMQLIPPTFDLPPGSIGTVRRKGDRFEIHVIADRPGGKFSGSFTYLGKTIEIPERTERFIDLLPTD